nr:10204_t:CDS:1 [Entrophospora candida]
MANVPIQTMSNNSIISTGKIELRNTWSEDGLDLYEKKDLEEPVTYREETTQWILSKVEKCHIMLIRGPRYSGKTSLCELLARHLENTKTENDQIISISHLSFSSKFATYENYWEAMTGKTYFEWQESFPDSRIYIIMDETQVTYHTTFQFFWNWVRVEQKNKNTNIRLIMFAVYPIILKDDKIIMESGPEIASPIGLHYKFGVRLLMSGPNEHIELMDDFVRKSGNGFVLTEQVKAAIIDLTAVRTETKEEDQRKRSCHLGLIRRILHFIYERHNPSYGYNPPTESEILKYLSSSTLFDHVSSHRGAIHLFEFNDRQKEIVRKVIENDFINITSNSQDYSTISSLCKAGVLHFIDKDLTQDFVTSQGRVGFLTNYIFIMCFTKLNQGTKDPIVPLNVDQFEYFLETTISRLDPDIVENSLGILIRKDKKGLLAERSWQMEFYRSAYSCLTEDYYISPDVGATFGTRGRLDFYINTELNWAVELAAEGKDISGHVQRFQQENKYKNIPHSKKIVLDFRIGTNIKVVVPGAWHILYNKPSRAFVVKKSGMDDQIIQLSKSKVRFTTSGVNEIEGLLQEAQIIKAKVDVKKAENEMKRQNVEEKDLELSQKRQKIEEENLKIEEKNLKINELQMKIKYWENQGNLDNMAKYRKQLDSLMDD